MAIVLREGDEISAPHTSSSEDGRFALVMTRVGHLSLYRHDLAELHLLWRRYCNSGINGVSTWARVKNGFLHGGYYFNGVENTRWRCPPDPYNRAVPSSTRKLHLQNDGNLVLYSYSDNDDLLGPLWATGTNSLHANSINPAYPVVLIPHGTLAISGDMIIENATNEPINVSDNSMAVVLQSGGTYGVVPMGPGSLAIDVCSCSHNYETQTGDAVGVDITSESDGNVVRIVPGQRRPPDFGLGRTARSNNFAGTRLPELLHWFES